MDRSEGAKIAGPPEKISIDPLLPISFTAQFVSLLNIHDTSETATYS